MAKFRFDGPKNPTVDNTTRIILKTDPITGEATEYIDVGGEGEIPVSLAEEYAVTLNLHRLDGPQVKPARETYDPGARTASTPPIAGDNQLATPRSVEQAQAEAKTDESQKEVSS